MPTLKEILGDDATDEVLQAAVKRLNVAVDDDLVKRETDPDKTGKLTQAEVDKIVSDRTAQERAKTKKALEDLDALRNAGNEEIDKYKKIVQGNLDASKKSLPDAVKKLLEKLDPLDQLEWLSDPENVKPVERAKIPQTPDDQNAPETVESHPKLPFGLGR